MKRTFDVVPAASLPVAELVSALSAGFARELSTEWFEWKHREAPWGPSEGWAALDSDGVVGVRLFTPWRLRRGDETVVARRAMDGATVPRARRHGVFETLVRAEMTSVRAQTAGGLLFSTAVPASRAAYEKHGWVTIGTVGTTLGLRHGRGRARVTLGLSVDALSTPSIPAETIATDWNLAALRWRVDPRSGHAYEVARLAEADRDAGLVFRVARRRGLRVLVVAQVWGATRDARELVAGAARQRRCPAILSATGLGSKPLAVTRVGRRRAGYALTVWAHGDVATGWPFTDLSRWALDLADLEGVL